MAPPIDAAHGTSETVFSSFQLDHPIALQRNTPVVSEAKKVKRARTVILVIPPHRRRAKRDDLAAMAALMTQASNGAISPSETVMMENLFSKGYFLAQAGEQLLGLVGLRTENLIAGIDDFLVRSSDLWPTVGKAMMKGVEKEAGELSCEVALLFARPEAGPVAMAFFERSGYQRQSSQDLIKMWREAAEDYYTEGSVLMVKQLLERRIMSPL